MPKIIYVYIQNFVWEKSEVKLIDNEFRKKKKKNKKDTLINNKKLSNWLTVRKIQHESRYQ